MPQHEFTPSGEATFTMRGNPPHNASHGPEEAATPSWPPTSRMAKTPSRSVCREFIRMVRVVSSGGLDSSLDLLAGDSDGEQHSGSCVPSLGGPVLAIPVRMSPYPL